MPYAVKPAPEPSIWPGRLLGRIEGCTNPESAELLPDGESFVFGNCAMMVGHPAYREGQGLVYLQGEAFISRARLNRSGSVALEERRLITGLTGTLGTDVLRVGTERFPAGTFFMAEGGNPITRPGAADLVTDPRQVRQRALAFDPLSGVELGSIPLWEGSEIAARFNALDQPNGLAIDSHGNLYVGDIPNGNPVAGAPPRGVSAVYRIPHEALDALASGTPGAADGVSRVVISGHVNGVTVSPLDDTCWSVSCSAHDPVQGGIYRLTDSDFATGKLPEPHVRGLGVLDGVGVTRRGTLLASNPRTSEIHAFTTDGVHHVVRLDGEPVVRMPADFNVCYPAALAGEPALLVTDISVGMPPGDATVAVVDISAL